MMIDIQEFQYIGRLNFEQNQLDFEQDIDPESNLFKNIHTNYGYFTEKEFNNKIIHGEGISVIHINSRSMYANFHSIKD